MPVPEEPKWKRLLKKMLGYLAPIAATAQQQMRARELASMGSLTGGTSAAAAQRFVQVADAASGGMAAMESQSMQGLSETMAAVADPNPLETPAALAESMDERLDRVRAVHECYTADSEPSLDQCWADDTTGAGPGGP